MKLLFWKDKTMRLNKYLSDAGVCSRREADRLTEAGEITVNGKRAETGMQVESGDVVVVKGKTVVPEEKKVYLAFNKPRGIVCTAEKREKNNVMLSIIYFADKKWRGSRKVYKIKGRTKCNEYEKFDTCSRKIAHCLSSSFLYNLFRNLIHVIILFLSLYLFLILFFIPGVCL